MVFRMAPAASLQDSPEHSGSAVGSPVSAVSPSRRWALQAALGPRDALDEAAKD